MNTGGTQGCVPCFTKYGREVVAKGYLKSPQGPVPITWIDAHTFRIEFMEDRYGEALAPQTVNLKLD